MSISLKDMKERLAKPSIKRAWIAPAVEESLRSIYSDNTMKTVKSSITNLNKALFNQPYFDIDKFLDNSDLVLNFLHLSKSGKTLANYIVQILKRYPMTANQKAKFVIIENYFHTLSRFNYVEPSDKEKKMLSDGLNYDQLVKKREELARKLEQKPDQSTLLKFIILCLYSYLPPLRQSELISTKFVNLPKYDDNVDVKILEGLLISPNFISLNNKKMVLSNYKTVATHGVRIIDIPDILVEILRFWQDITKSEWLLPLLSNNSKPIKSSGITHILNNIFGMKISSSMLRKLYISQHVFDGQMTTQEKEKIAKIMGHKPVSQVLTYGRFSELLHPELARPKIQLKKKITS